MTYFDLMPTDGHKSFYGKAYVACHKDGGQTLYSYGTPIIYKAPNGDLKRLWKGWTATTGRHIMAFCGLNKKGFDALPM